MCVCRGVVVVVNGIGEWRRRVAAFFFRGGEIVGAKYWGDLRAEQRDWGELWGFLVATKRRYKSVCPSVGQMVGP